MLRKIFVACLLLFLLSSARAQTKTIERLKLQIENAHRPEDKLGAIFDLCEQGYTLLPDTLMMYAAQAATLATQQKNLHDEVKAMYYKSFALTNKGLIDSSLAVADECLQVLSFKIKDPVLLANVLNQKGRCFMRKNQYKEAIEMGYRVIDESERSNDTLLQIKGKTLIGWAYLEMDQTKEALAWHLKALRTTGDSLMLGRYAILFANLALNYNSIGKNDSGLYFINKAIYYSRKHENLFALSNSLAIQAQLYGYAGQSKSAEAPLKELVGIRKLIGDPFYIVSDMAQLALYYARNGEPEKGIAICNEGIAVARKFKIDTKLLFLYTALAENYNAQHNTEKYAAVLEKIIEIKDSVYQKNSAEAVAEMQSKYDLQRKENLIIRQQIDINRQRYLFLGILTLLLFSAIVARLLYKQYARKNKLRIEAMMLQEKQFAREAVVRAEENERKRIAVDLHDNMGAYASAISANVDDLMEQNQGSMILKNMKNNAVEIMLTLRDTIWVLNKDRITITGISDRFKSYVQKIITSYPGIEIGFKEKITNDISLSPESALNMLRILQEAFHNAIKHSKCTHIIIEIESVNEPPAVRITDNGIGFTSDVQGNGNGLENMKARAKANGWELIIESRQPSGTSVKLNA